MTSRCLLSLCALLLSLSSASLLSANESDRVHFARNIYIAGDESVGSVVCIACSIRMEGTCGDVVAIGGSIMITGDVHGDAVAVGGSMQLDNDATVDGDAVTVGGRLWRNGNASVKGDMVSRSGLPILIGLIVVPLVPLLLIIALVVWLVGRNRRASAPMQVSPRR
jgi:hypothetical protein